MIRGSDPCFPSSSEPEGVHDPSQLYHDVMEASYGGAVVGSETQLRSLLCSLSVLKQKVHEVETLVSMFLSHENHHHQSQPFASIGTLIQEIVVNASSMMFNCQQMTINSSSQTGNHNSNSNSNNNSDNNSHPMQSEAELANNNNNPHHFVANCGVISKISSNNQEFLDGDQSFFTWYSNDNNNPSYNNNNNISINTTRKDTASRATCSTVTATTTTTTSKSREKRSSSSSIPEPYDLVEPDAADLLAKYTHYCQVCGKGFKRDANLRMHMRAHGDEYKSTAALSNPLKKEGVREESSEMKPPRKYSCPQQGCRWNKNHAKFQPLKSIICVKNHYKRSHCPKMYVCKRCNRKNFSVLSDLRTHEKHCGDRKWQCSCGTTFSRKDKLMGHVTLFVGHTPIVHSLAHSNSKLDNHGELQIQFEDR